MGQRNPPKSREVHDDGLESGFGTDAEIQDGWLADLVHVEWPQKICFLCLLRFLTCRIRIIIVPVS